MTGGSSVTVNECECGFTAVISRVTPLPTAGNPAYCMYSSGYLVLTTAGKQMGEKIKRRHNNHYAE
ncbi:uncharacterized protein V6R79_018781 [Siganus canaliculatus]